MMGIYVGRQPIFNQHLKVVGYELLFRDFNTDKANVVNGDHATLKVILNSFMEIGLQRIVGKEPAFINLTRSFILEKIPIPFPKEHVVIEVLEDITIDDELIAALKSLSSRGYRIALDDVVNPRLVGPLLDIANIVKLDIMGIDMSSLKEYVRYLRKYDVKLLAEKIETLDILETCKSSGFDYFQGYFLSRPNVVEGHSIPPARLNLLRLLSELQNPDLKIRDIEQIITSDVSLSYKLIRLINSVFYKTTMRVKSITQAITLLGLRQIRDWVSLLFLTSIDDKPRELLVTAMIRAKMCELLGKASREKVSDVGFTVGLFSVLDALLDVPMEDVLKSLPLTAEISGALLHHEGHFGAILNCVIAYENNDWENTQCPGIPPERIREAYLKSIEWANAVSAALIE
ncbi:HDOD domain-containing protein [bacterium]|nr:HDOD domain-containing protein [bacterium]